MNNLRAKTSRGEATSETGNNPVLDDISNRLRLLINTMAQGVIFQDSKGNIIYCNKAAERILGLSMDQMIGRTASDLNWNAIREDGSALPEDSHPFTIAMRTGEEVGYRVIGVRNPILKKHIWLKVRAVPIFKESGKHPYEVYSIFEDITQRMVAEEALRESQQMLLTILDTIPVRVFWKDRSSKYIGCNNPFARDSGLMDPEQLIGRDDHHMVWKDQAEKYIGDDRLVMETGAPKLNYEEEQTTPDGRRIWLKTSKVPLRNMKGEIKGVLGTYEDITEQKKSEEALRRSEERFRSIITNTPNVAVELYDQEGRVIFWNQAAANLFSIEPMEALGKTLDTLFLEKADEEEFRGILREVERTWKPHGPSEWKCACSNGVDKYLMSTIFPLRDEGGRTVFVRMDMDITERELAKQQLLNERNRAEFYLDLLSHDIGNIHQGISSWTQIAKLKDYDEKMRRIAISKLEELEKRSIRLVRNVLLLSRLKNMKGEFVPIDLVPLITKVADDVKTIFSERCPELTVTCQMDHAVTIAEPVIEEVFFNLLHNGIKFQYGKHPVVEVAIIPKDDGNGMLVVEISDHGIGIPDELKGTLFDRHLKTVSYDYSGIGLSLVKELIGRYGGSIEIRDRVHGDHRKGAKFRLTLPVAAS